MKDDRLPTHEHDVDVVELCHPRNSLSSLDGYIPVLDGIRGVAILLVMAFHFLKPTGHYLATVPYAIAHTGWVGVDLFFVLSGFLITGILLRTKADPHYLRNFYVRRTLRIFPLYYAFLTAIFVAGAYVTILHTSGFRDVAAHQIWLWTYTTNIGGYWKGTGLFVGGWVQLNHLWSLAVEEQFYLIWPAIVLFFSRDMLKRLSFLIIVSAIVFRLYANTFGDGFVLWRADALIVGGLIAILVRDPLWAPRMKRLATRTMWVTGVLLVGIFVWRGEFIPKDVVVRAVGMSMIMLFFGASLTVIMSLPIKHWCVQWLNHSVLTSFGKYSYGIYLFHYEIGRMMSGRLFPAYSIKNDTVYWLLVSYMEFAFKIVLSYGMAWLSWHIFEKHLLKLKRFFVCRTTLPFTAKPAETAGSL